MYMREKERRENNSEKLEKKVNSVKERKKE